MEAYLPFRSEHRRAFIFRKRGCLQASYKRTGQRTSEEAVPFHWLKAGSFGIEQAFESAICLETSSLPSRETPYPAHEQAGRGFYVALRDLEVGEKYIGGSGMHGPKERCETFFGEKSQAEAGNREASFRQPLRSLRADSPDARPSAFRQKGRPEVEDCLGVSGGGALRYDRQELPGKNSAGRGKERHQSSISI